MWGGVGPEDFTSHGLATQEKGTLRGVLCLTQNEKKLKSGS